MTLGADPRAVVVFFSSLASSVAVTLALEVWSAVVPVVSLTDVQPTQMFRRCSSVPAPAGATTTFEHPTKRTGVWELFEAAAVGTVNPERTKSTSWNITFSSPVVATR